MHTSLSFLRQELRIPMLTMTSHVNYAMWVQGSNWETGQWILWRVIEVASPYQPCSYTQMHMHTCAHEHSLTHTHTCAAQRYTRKTNPHICTHITTPICTIHIYRKRTYIPVYIQIHILVRHTYTWKTHANTYHTLKKSQEIPTPILSMGSHFSKSYLCIHL